MIKFQGCDSILITEVIKSNQRERWIFLDFTGKTASRTGVRFPSESLKEVRVNGLFLCCKGEVSKERVVTAKKAYEEICALNGRRGGHTEN